jgi:hypothetical protein
MKIEPSMPRPLSPAGPGRRGQPCASFAELSMFGRPHATAAQAGSPSAATPITPARVGADPLPAGPATMAVLAGAHARPAAPGKAGQPLQAVQQQVPAGRARQPAPDAMHLPEAGAGETLALQSPDAPIECEPLRRARARLRQAALKAGISLILCEEDGAVRLVIGGPPLDPEQQAEARRLADRILAESGLALTHFQLNGAAIGPDSTERKGERYGTRTD